MNFNTSNNKNTKETKKKNRQRKKTYVKEEGPRRGFSLRG